MSGMPPGPRPRTRPRPPGRRRATGPALCIAVALGSLAGSLAAWLAAAGSALDEHRLAPTRASVVITDRDLQPLRITLGADDQWQLPVPLEHLSPWLLAATVAVEDERFWQHRGVDALAVARAAWSNLTKGRLVSGASTITMQLARLAVPEARGWKAKARQALRALRLEHRHSKEWILESYLNQAPFGGNLVGVEAAARAYFGTSARHLGLAESALLVGLPQRPSAYHPVRHPELARQRRRRVLERLVDTGVITAARARQTDALPLGVMPHQAGRPPPGWPCREPLFCTWVSAQCRPLGGTTLHTTLDPRWQEIARTALAQQVAQLPGVRDGAAVILDNPSGAVRALVGTLDLHADQGWVNAACRPRSPGSALKPFLVASALDAGLAVPETRVADLPLTVADYRPGNLDGHYRGLITLREALARSRNPPAVRLLQQLGPAHVHAALLDCGLNSLARRPPDALGLSLALGSGEVTLLELTQAYATLARQGDSRPLRLTADAPAPPPGRAPFSPGAASLVIDMLSTYPLPGAPRLPVAWKTGTSSGHRDAWCVALNREVTVGVWLGNKNGRPAASLAGAPAAAPPVADILTRLYADEACPPLPAPVGTRPVTLCRASGLAAGFACRELQPGLRPAQVPLRTCPLCRPGTHERPLSGTEFTTGTEAQAPPRILLPRPGTYRRGREPVRLTLGAAAGEPLLWYVNGEFLGRFGQRDRVPFAGGTYRVQAVREPTGETDAISLRVD